VFLVGTEQTLLAKNKIFKEKNKMAWTIRKGFNTPKGIYTPKTDDLTVELVAAAEFAGLDSFNVKIDGHYVDDPTALQTNSIKALVADVSIESVEVEARDTAGSR
jgi:hypothetical protein